MKTKTSSFRGIRGRWLQNDITLIALIVVTAVVALSLGLWNYYYAAVRTGLENKAQTATEFFTSYVSKNYLEFYQSAYRYTESFEDKDSVELQFVNTKG